VRPWVSPSDDLDEPPGCGPERTTAAERCTHLAPQRADTGLVIVTILFQYFEFGTKFV